jgi:hypothetical protein
MLVSVTENIASLHLKPSGPQANAYTVTSMSLHGIAHSSTRQLSKWPTVYSFLQSAFETGMNKVIADVLENISFMSDPTVETKSSRHVEDHSFLEPRSVCQII